MKNPKIRIESDGTTTEIYYMGEQIRACTSVEFSHRVCEEANCLITQNTFHPDYKPKLSNELL